MPLSQLIYVSTALPGMNDNVLTDILDASRRNNKRVGVTGMLLYIDRSFLQVLEGEEDAVKATYSRIQGDPRHKGLLLLYKDTVADRSFVDWSMGFERLQKSEAGEIAGVFEISTAAVSDHVVEAEAARVLRFMQTFYQVTTRRRI